MADDYDEQMRKRWADDAAKFNGYMSGLNGGTRPPGFEAGGAFDQGAEQRARSFYTPPPPPPPPPPPNNNFTNNANYSGGGYTYASGGYTTRQQSGGGHHTHTTNAHYYSPTQRISRTELPTEKDNRVMQWRYLCQFDLLSSIPALLTLPFNPGLGLAALTGGAIGYAAGKITNNRTDSSAPDAPFQKTKPVYRTMKTEKAEYVNGAHTLITTSKKIHIKNTTRVLAWSGLVGKAAGAGLAHLTGASQGFAHVFTYASPMLLAAGGLVTSAYVVGRDIHNKTVDWTTAAKALLGTGIAAVGIITGGIAAPSVTTPSYESYAPRASHAMISAYVTAKELNVHAGPGGKITTTLDCGNRVKLTFPLHPGWNEVSYGWFSRSGHVWGQYLSGRQPACQFK